MSNSQAGGPTLVGCPRLPIQYLRSYPSYLEGFPPFASFSSSCALASRMSCDPPTGPQGLFSWTSLFCMSLPFWPARLWHAPPSYFLPDPHPILTLLCTGLAKALPRLIGSFFSNQFHAHCLLITLMMEAALTSEMFVRFYQTM